MKVGDLNTPVPITWCPGCPNFGILNSAKRAITELVNEGFAPREKFVAVSGIGCHAKIYDYINVSGFYGLHGRAIPVANGITLGNPELKVLTFAGDGDAYAEGISHWLHACRMNPDYALFVHDNKVFALTTGQFTPTTELGFPAKSTPKGNPVPPINPVAVALEAGAGFVARESALDPQHLAETMKAAVRHRGFAFVDIVQPCRAFHDFSGYVQDRFYRVEPAELPRALETAREWDYSAREDARIPLGIFYREEKPTLADMFGAKAWHTKYPKRKVRPDLWDTFKV
jgi:2-oxoglutarate ferredoxin oxidoreductase subunit beta